MQKFQHRIVFMGSPEYVVPVLVGLAKYYLLCGVVTQPDRQAGRNRVVIPTPVKKYADEMGIENTQPEKLSDNDFINKLRAWRPAVVVVAAYGKIIPEYLFDFPSFGFINMHASLLPRWRGASPIQATILSGDEVGGMTIIKIDKGLDTGPIISQCEVPVMPGDTFGSLRTRLFHLGTDLMLRTLPEYLNGKIIPKPQIESKVTYSRMIKKSEGELDFKAEAAQIERKVRAYNPWPICYIKWQGNPLRIYEVIVSPTKHLAPNQKGIIERYPAIGTSTNDVQLIKVQAAGKNVIDGRQFLNGARNWPT